MALFGKGRGGIRHRRSILKKRYYIVVTAPLYFRWLYTESECWKDVYSGAIKEASILRTRQHNGSRFFDEVRTAKKLREKRACPFLHAKSSIMDSIRSLEREGSACFDPWPRNDINHVVEAIGVKSSVSISCRHFLLLSFPRRVNKEWNQCDDDEANCCLALCPFGTALEREESRGQ